MIFSGAAHYHKHGCVQTRLHDVQPEWNGLFENTTYIVQYQHYSCICMSISLNAIVEIRDTPLYRWEIRNTDIAGEVNFNARKSVSQLFTETQYVSLFKKSMVCGVSDRYLSKAFGPLFLSTNSRRRVFIAPVCLHVCTRYQAAFYFLSVPES